MDAEKQFSVQEWTKILNSESSHSCPKAVLSQIPRWKIPHDDTIKSLMIQKFRDTGSITNNKTHSDAEHRHTFRILGLIWNSQHWSPQDGWQRKWGFPVLWWESFMATWNCFHIECRFLRLKAMPTRSNTMNLPEYQWTDQEHFPHHLDILIFSDEAHLHLSRHVN